MTYSMKECIKKRKSVRTFDGRELTQEDKKNLETYVQGMSNPFNVPVTFRLLEADAYHLSSPVVLGTDLYMAAKAKRIPGYELALGYSFEKACLYALSLGIGTVMLAASLSRDAFETAMDVQPDEVMPVASPIGYPAKKRSIRENLMRKGMKSDDRIAFDQLFFDEEYGKGLVPEKAGLFAEALELVRWAPSATNKQPWRAIVKDNKVHFYEMKSMKDSPLGDIQKVDLGIALCHFEIGMDQKGSFMKEDPQLETAEMMEYIMTYEVA